MRLVAKGQLFYAGHHDGPLFRITEEVIGGPYKAVVISHLGENRGDPVEYAIRLSRDSDILAECGGFGTVGEAFEWVSGYSEY